MAEIVGTFDYTAMSPEQIAQANRVRRGFEELEIILYTEIPVGNRLLSIALTHLETAALFAIKAVSRSAEPDEAVLKSPKD